MRDYPPNNDPSLLALFPGTATTLGRGGGEVNGLAKDAVPQGTIHGSAMSTEFERDRVFHVVDCNEERFYLRVCAAMPGESYDAFAVIHDRAKVGTPKAQEMLERYQRRVRDGFFTEIPKSVVPTIANSAHHMENIASSPKHLRFDNFDSLTI